MYGISRTEAPPGNWTWTAHVRRRGTLLSGRFSDLMYGGPEASKAAALVWRDKILKKIPALTVCEFNAIKRSNNTSGVPGVFFLRTKRQPSCLWQAKTKKPEGGFMTNNYSVLRFGERAAYRLAAAARRRHLELIDDRPFLHSAAARAIEAKKAVARTGRR